MSLSRVWSVLWNPRAKWSLAASTSRLAAGRLTDSLAARTTCGSERPYSVGGGSQPRILITGGLGQLGSGLALMMRDKYGRENVLLSDVHKPTEEILNEGPYVYADVLDLKHLHSIVVNYRIDWVIHFAALLSAIGEQQPRRALDVNVDGFHNIIELCQFHKLRLFVPSTIGAFGPESPKMMCPDLTIMRPKTVYGVSKVHGELLGEYYHSRFGVDYRSLRFPGVISADTQPGGGTTDYAVHIFHEIIKHGRYSCFLSQDTRLPMIFLPDCLRAVVELMETPEDKLTLRTYNLAAISFSPGELVSEMKKHLPDMKVEYEPDAQRQAIADSWPEVLDDSRARWDWGWKHEYDLPAFTQVMIERIQQRTQ